MSANLKLGWAVDFLDEPFDGSDFKFWSGDGPLSIGSGTDAITYQGTNGVISIEPPREKSSEATRMRIEMDASDSAIRQQLRRDIGPLRIRVRWLHYTQTTIPAQVVRVEAIAQTYIRSIIFSATDATRAWPIGGVFRVRFLATGGSNAIDTTSDFYIRVTNRWAGNNWFSCAVFDTRANALAGSNDPFVNNTGRLNLTDGMTDQNSVDMDVYESEESSAGTQWVLTGKEFIGRLSSPVISGATYVMDVESQITDIDRGRIIDWSNDTQQQKHPEDKGMEYLAEYAEGFNTKWPP